ncbi:hypothetical protein HYV69_00305 [Candidatus Uhrbacteria bacterium]|nr:hypothetical protein [Candidatus Uhrbacteria bacterium]
MTETFRPEVGAKASLSVELTPNMKALPEYAKGKVTEGLARLTQEILPQVNEEHRNGVLQLFNALQDVVVEGKFLGSKTEK